MNRELTRAELYAFVIIMCLCGGYFLGESYLHFFFSRDLTHEPSQFDRMVDTMFGGALLTLMTVLIVFTRLFMLELEAEKRWNLEK